MKKEKLPNGLDKVVEYLSIHRNGLVSLVEIQQATNLSRQESLGALSYLSSKGALGYKLNGTNKTARCYLRGFNAKLIDGYVEAYGHSR